MTNILVMIFSASYCANAQNTIEIRECLSGILLAEEQKEQRAFAALSKQLPSMTQQQSAWKSVAAARCDAVMHAFDGGTIAPAMYLSCMICETQAHTRSMEFLSDLLTPEGSVTRITARAKEPVCADL